ncbi:MAG: hypothetical protein WC378_03410 [Opitutaceae bacterium]|jgi:nucleoside phosphorylase
MPIADIAIICALKVEAGAVCQHLKELSEFKLGPYQCHFGHVERRGDDRYPLVRVAVLLLDRMGNLASLHAANLILQKVFPRQIFLVGICGGFKKTITSYNKGDIVVSDRVFYYEPQKKSSGNNENRGRDLFWSVDSLGTYVKSPFCILAEKNHDGIPVLQVDASLIRSSPPGLDIARYKPTTHVGIVCSGEKIIADETFVDELLKQSPQAISVEMEAAGVATACLGTGTSFLVIKAVQDFADKDKSDDWRIFAAESAAAFALTLITYPFHSAVRNSASNEHGLTLPNRPQPLSFLADFIGASPNKGLAIVLPSYKNLRHRNRTKKFSNYPLNEWDTAFDDIYCTFRILPNLLHLCAGKKPKILFDRAIEHDEYPNDENVLLVGSSVANVFTQDQLAQNEAFYSFGQGASDHDIIDKTGKVCFSAETIDSRRGSEYLKRYIKDYAMISVFHENTRSTCILAGCRAFSQMLLGDFLTDGIFLEDFYRHVYGCDFQCIIGVRVIGKDYDFPWIAAFKKRSTPNSPWVDVNLPSDLVNDIGKSSISESRLFVHLR